MKKSDKIAVVLAITVLVVGFLIFGLNRPLSLIPQGFDFVNTNKLSDTIEGVNLQLQTIAHGRIDALIKPFYPQVNKFHMDSIPDNYPRDLPRVMNVSGNSDDCYINDAYNCFPLSVEKWYTDDVKYSYTTRSKTVDNVDVLTQHTSKGNATCQAQSGGTVHYTYGGIKYLGGWTGEFWTRMGCDVQVFMDAPECESGCELVSHDEVLISAFIPKLGHENSGTTLEEALLKSTQTSQIPILITEPPLTTITNDEAKKVELILKESDTTVTEAINNYTIISNISQKTGLSQNKVITALENIKENQTEVKKKNIFQKINDWIIDFFRRIFRYG